MDIDDPKCYLSLILGIIVAALGVIPLLNKWNIIGFQLPGFLSGLYGSFGLWIIAGVGFWLLIDSFLDFQDNAGVAVVTLIVALVVLAVGLVPLLNTFGVISFSISFLNVIPFYVIFTVEGIFLIVSAFTLT